MSHLPERVTQEGPDDCGAGCGMLSSQSSMQPYSGAGEGGGESTRLIRDKGCLTVSQAPRGAREELGDALRGAASSLPSS